MIFASLSFIFFILPLFLAFDFLSRKFRSVYLRNVVLLGVSLLFYIWGEVANVFILLVLGILNYVVGNKLPQARNPRFLVGVSVGINLAVLVGFKYIWWLLSFFVPEFAEKSVPMPLGISFFTFHAISYLIDVYRKQVVPAKTCLDFLTYFCMFPHLVAGPIVRYAQVSADLTARGPNKDLFAFGVYRFLLGLNKKVIIANSVAVMADSAFLMSSLGNLQFFDAWLGIIAYSLQIYFDFSGYSDMAIGLAAMAGFHFEENFRRPYFSTNIRDFWRRWHISLSSWLRDYLYIPLGGSRQGKFVTYRNLLIVFFLCGLWHGADTTFILWGLWHGVFLVMERMPGMRFLEKLPPFFARGYTLLIVLIGWVFFRADNISLAVGYLQNMFTFSVSPVALTYHAMAFIALVAGAVLCLAPDKYLPELTSRKPECCSNSMLFIQTVLAIVSVVLLLTTSRNPFIYFNF